LNSAGESDAEAWWKLAALRGLADGLRRQRGTGLPKNVAGLLAAPPTELASSLDGIRRVTAASTIVLKDRNRPLPERLAAVPLLEHLPKAEAAALVGPLTDRLEPAEIQRAVVDVLRRLDRPAVSAVLYDSLDRMGGVARAGALQFLQQNPAELLRNIKAGRLNPALVDAMGRWSILNSAKEDVRTLGREIFGSAEGDRKKLVRRYAAALPSLAGSAARGHEVFVQTCAVCHRFRGEGGDVGPDITDVRIKSPEMLLSDILDPNNTIDPRWEAVSFEAEGGRSVTGLVTSETADAIVVRSIAATDTLPRRSVTSSKPLGVSLMPQGLEGALTEPRMADLIAFLRSDPNTK
jgi:putative heme-binding domain-containing protein